VVVKEKPVVSDKEEPLISSGNNSVHSMKEVPSMVESI
jgi:hypothetical protein